MRKHMSYANVVATLALIVAVAGGTTAVAVSKKAGKNTVTSKSIKDGSVTGKDLAGVRVEQVTAVQQQQELRCRPGEKLLSAGVGGYSSSPFSVQSLSFGPTDDGIGYVRSGGGSLRVACLEAVPEG